jgi:uncharacterized protein YegL
MTDLRNFTIASARPLPVIVLADVSGSMTENGKISVLNRAIGEMVRGFSDASSARVEIQIAVIIFGGDSAKLHQDLISASKFTWQDIEAKGKTPLGSAFLLAKSIIEDKQKISSRAYTPALILVSDAKPTDTETTKDAISWQDALQELLNSERASKAARYALAIGDDANVEVMRAFLADPKSKIFQANEANEIHRFFRYVTMSVTARSRSTNPNLIPPTEPDDFDY